MRLLSIVLVLAASAQARAESPTVTREAEPERNFALAINPPFRWVDASAFALSGYLVLSERLALRANVARYDYLGSTAGPAGIVGILAGGDEEGTHGGHTSDAGIGLVSFSRRRHEGLMCEVGLLGRFRRTTQGYEFTELTTDANAVLGRVLLGWSWTIERRVIISFALGLSSGWASGTETESRSSYESMVPPMVTQRAIGHIETTSEGYIRLGYAFSL